MIAQAWQDRWEHVIPFLALPEGLRRSVYTTNSIEGLNRQMAARCLNRMGAEFLANVGTLNAARDMDIVRQAIGEPQINYLGFSYGTELGTAYSQAFPQNVRVVDDISKASSMAIWLDTVTHIDVANAYLNGVQAMLDGSKTPADVVADVQAGAASAKASTAQ